MHVMVAMVVMEVEVVMVMMVVMVVLEVQVQVGSQPYGTYRTYLCLYRRGEESLFCYLGRYLTLGTLA